MPGKRKFTKSDGSVQRLSEDARRRKPRTRNPNQNLYMAAAENQRPKHGVLLKGLNVSYHNRDL